jgi:hypothetical protein
MNKNVYGGVLQQPTTNYNAVRDGRRGALLYTVVDLSTARTDTGTGANAPLFINVAGNSFYVDADPVDGTAFVEFQDSGSDLSSARIYISPGAIFNIPFTQFKITNPAQTGKTLTIIYGTDVDFQPGSVSQIAIAGTIQVAPNQLNTTQAQNTVGVTAANLLPANTAREYMLIQNNGATDIYCRFDGGVATLTNGFKIAAGGGSIEFTGQVPFSAVSAISSASNTAVITLVA